MGKVRVQRAAMVPVRFPTPTPGFPLVLVQMNRGSRSRDSVAPRIYAPPLSLPPLADCDFIGRGKSLPMKGQAVWVAVPVDVATPPPHVPQSPRQGRGGKQCLGANLRDRLG